MKILAILIPLLMMILLVASDYEDDLSKCECDQEDDVIVCTDKGTFYSTCLVKCLNAEYYHDGECGNEELLDIERNDK